MNNQYVSVWQYIDFVSLYVHPWVILIWSSFLVHLVHWVYLVTKKKNWGFQNYVKYHFKSIKTLHTYTYNVKSTLRRLETRLKIFFNIFQVGIFFVNEIKNYQNLSNHLSEERSVSSDEENQMATNILKSP